MMAETIERGEAAESESVEKKPAASKRADEKLAIDIIGGK